jgi:hypothetical protein
VSFVDLAWAESFKALDRAESLAMIAFTESVSLPFAGTVSREGRFTAVSCEKADKCSKTEKQKNNKVLLSRISRTSRADVQIAINSHLRFS